MATQTQHNVFVRKFGNKAIVIMVTDWDDFKELEKHSEKPEPDFLISGVTSKGNIYCNCNTQTIFGVRGDVKDITDETKGAGLAGIITGESKAGPIWAYRKISGLCAVSEMVTVKI